MPYSIRGEIDYKPSYSYIDKDYPEYRKKYPNNLNLKPGSEQHNEIRDKIWTRALAARQEISKRYDSWRAIDRTLTIYVEPDYFDNKVKAKDPKKPTTIVFPYTYAMLEALLTYLSSAFFRDPLFPYEGFEAEDTIGAALLELVISRHCKHNKVSLNLHTMFRDALAYGIGVVIPSWKRQYGLRPVRINTDSYDPTGQIITSRSVNMIHDMLFEGNKLCNIDPYMVLPDPSVSSNNIQDGEFFGWVDRSDNYMNLLSKENESDSGYFNVKYLRRKTGYRSSLALDQSERYNKTGGTNNLRANNCIVNPVDTIKIFITLIPSEWKLSDSDNPEKWYFELASDDIIIRAEQAEYSHGMYPVAMASPEADGYNIAPLGRLEILGGLQHTLDFLFNSHITNLRKAVNDMLVVDPFLVNIEDLKDPEPGKIIRLRRPAWGRGVDKVVQQLNINDVTRTNIADSAYITGWMDRLGGADSSMSGVLRSGGPERLTKGEFQGTRDSSMSRIQRIAQIIGSQAIQDIGLMFAMHTQEYMSQDTYVKLVGRHAEKLQKIYGVGNDYKKVSPYDLAVAYDIVSPDGSIPGASFNGEFWARMFEIVAAQPELYQAFDLTRIFLHIAEESGAKNAQDFIRKAPVVVQPNEIVDSQVQQGNLVPMGV